MHRAKITTTSIMEKHSGLEEPPYFHHHVGQAVWCYISEIVLSNITHTLPKVQLLSKSVHIISS